MPKEQSQKNGVFTTSHTPIDGVASPPILQNPFSSDLLSQVSHAPPWQQALIQLIDGLPIPALVLTSIGKIVAANAPVQALMPNVESWLWEGQVADLWEALQWPSVPFQDWEWEGHCLSCWDHDVALMGTAHDLTIRYITSPVRAGILTDDRERRLARIGERAEQLAHNIRNPLTSIEWFATLLGGGRYSQEERQKMVDHCVQAIRSLDGLVSNLLTYSCPAQKPSDIINISALLDEVEWLAMYPIHQKEVTIGRYQDAGLTSMNGQELLIKQAVLNLLLNAIHASSTEGHIEIAFRRGESDVAKDEGMGREQGIVFTITDYGCGIGEDEVSRVFQPFFSTRKGGTGLGLSSVKQVVHIHQGMIDLSSEKGKGTTVRIFFPQ